MTISQLKEKASDKQEIVVLTEKLMAKEATIKALLDLAKECHLLLYNGIKKDLVKRLGEAIAQASSESNG